MIFNLPSQPTGIPDRCAQPPVPILNIIGKPALGTPKNPITLIALGRVEIVILRNIVILFPYTGIKR